MASEDIYEACAPLLNDGSLEEEEKIDKLEDLVRKEAKLNGKALETAVLDILRRFRHGNTLSVSPSHTVRKSRSPAPWQQASRSATPIGSLPRSNTASPAPSSIQRPSFLRMQSHGSPFTSPKPSPRFAFSSPHIPHSPNLDAYEFTPGSSTPDIYGDFGSSEVDWLVNDDSANPMTPGTAEWVPGQTVEMSPYDILRSVLRDDKSDTEIEQVLESSGYDLSTAIAAFMEGQAGAENNQYPMAPVEQDRTYLVGKSMAPGSRPATPAGQQKSPIVCRYWLSTGQCLRADCRFSHDLSHHVCKYWLQGNCLAGNSCIFSHDPALLVGNLSLGAGGPSVVMTPPLETAQAYQVQDYTSFPSLASTQPMSPSGESSLRNLYNNDDIAPPPGITSRPALAPEFIPSRPQSRPSSRHQSPGPRSSGLTFDDGEAFPSLSAAGVRGPRKHHGKRGHGHGHGHRDKEVPGSLADIVRLAPTPAQPQSPRRTLRGRVSYTGTREYSTAAQAVPSPEKIPWLETGDRANKAYLKARQDAIRHGGARNKFLQSAAQAWNRNDVRAAKTLSLRGQSENQHMRDAHRVAAKALYEDRNKHLTSSSPTDETYVDLHGLHPAEAVSYLAAALVTQRSTSAIKREEEGSRAHYLYAIVGTGHHSRGGRDKVGRAIRAYLNECRYAFREFGVPGDRPSGGGGYFAQPGSTGAYMGDGGILGIDVTTGDMNRDAVARIEATASSTGGEGAADDDGEGEGPPVALSQPEVGKVRILKADPRERSGNGSGG